MSQPLKVVSLSPGKGAGWIKGGWQLYKKAPFKWIGLFIAVYGVSWIVTLIPIAGIVLNFLVVPALIAGLYRVALTLDTQNKFVLKDVFYVLQKRFVDYFILAVLEWLIFLGFAAVVVLPFGFGTAKQLVTLFSTPNSPGNSEILMHALPLLAVLLLGSMVIGVCLAFAPILVVLADRRPVEAIKLSFQAGIKNVGPLTVASLILFALGIVAVIPLGLGLLVVIPVFNLAIYKASSEMFAADRV